MWYGDIHDDDYVAGDIKGSSSIHPVITLCKICQHPCLNYIFFFHFLNVFPLKLHPIGYTSTTSATKRNLCEWCCDFYISIIYLTDLMFLWMSDLMSVLPNVILLLSHTWDRNVRYVNEWICIFIHISIVVLMKGSKLLLTRSWNQDMFDVFLIN